jgi:hypothetical protein
MLAAAAFVVAMVVLVGGTVVAFVEASGNDGATDATGAVQALLDAVGRNDAIGVLDALPPDEREAFRDNLPGIVDELQRLGVVDPLSLSQIPGLSVELKGIKLRDEPLSDEVGRVSITEGQLIVTPQDGFPLPERTRAWLDDDFHATVDPATGSHTIDVGASQPSFVAVKDSGGWHASLLYTLGEAIRGGGSGPLPRFNAGPTPIGSGTPEGAVRDLVSAAANLDPTRAVNLAYPTEARALYDYASLFLPEAQRRARAIEQDEPFALSIKQLDLAVEGDGSTRDVRVTGADIVITDGGDQVELNYADHCLTTTFHPADDSQPQSTDKRCDGRIEPAPANSSNPTDPDTTDPTRLDRLTGWQALGRAFPTFVVEERNGRWYVSPVRTVLTTIEELLHTLGPDDVAALSDRLAWAWDLYGIPAAPSTR